MRHLDPVQIATPEPRRPARKLTLLWLISMIAVTVGLGAAASVYFAADGQDQVTITERQDRQVAFTKLRDLRTAEIPDSQLDATLDEMRLAPPDRAKMRALLPADNAAHSIGAPSTGSAIAPPPSLTPKKAPLRLASISVWDTHAVDGDVVAIVSAGYRREVVLTKAGETIAFPVDQAATVEIVGIRDGGGGITLGIRGPSQEILMPIMSEGQTLSLPLAR
jgi:hypothetical protein